jgi:hypothetical protein
MSVNNLITLAEAKGALRFDETTADDARIDLLIGAASLSVLRYLRSTGEEYRNTNGDIVPGNVEDDIKHAVIMLVGMLDRNVDANETKIFASDALPANIEALLHSRRDPALA